MKNGLFALLFWILVSPMGFASDAEDDVIKTIKAYEKALNGNDVSTILSLYDSSPTFMPQHAKAQVGREAVEVAYKNVFKAIDLDVVFTIHDVEVTGDTAWARTSTLGKTKILANGAVVSEGNNELFVFKKQKGKWKIHQYLFSTNLPHKQ